MSGGVDSSVAAALLKREGLEVVGVSMELYRCDQPLARGCCTPVDRLDAQRVCEQLQIPYEVLDLRAAFRKEVMEYFAGEYARGRTPLPCAPCNSKVRFTALLDFADAAGAYWLATGHYSRISFSPTGEALLRRGLDPKKDQSYFLWGLSQNQLQRLKLPIGSHRKEEVRALAKEWGLVTFEKEESQDLCFVGNDDHARFLESHFPASAFPVGFFVDAEGRHLGRHQGVHAYTIGQRRGLGVSGRERMYVTRLDPQKNEIELGSKSQLRAHGLMASHPHWMGPSPERAVVKIRSTHPGVLARIASVEEELQILFEEPQEAVTPGQAAVFYEGDRCLGGAWIERAIA